LISIRFPYGDAVFMRELHTETEIDAAPEAVWRVLTDFPSFYEWNPFITSIAGQPEEGARLSVRIEPPGGRAMTFKPTVIVAEPARELRWLGRLIIPGVMDGEHIFIIEPMTENRVRFVQHEKFTGILVPVILPSIATGTEQGFRAMNEALRIRVQQPPLDFKKE